MSEIGEELKATTLELVRIIITTDFEKGVSAIQKIGRVEGVSYGLKLSLARLILDCMAITSVSKIGPSLEKCFSILLEVRIGHESLVFFIKSVSIRLLELSHKQKIHSAAVYELKSQIYSVRVTLLAKRTRVLEQLLTLQ